MKIISEFLALTITASSSDASFPATNMALLDPGTRWKAGAFIETVTVTGVLPSATSGCGLYLGNPNFDACSVAFYNAGDSLISSASGAPLKDKSGRRKLYVACPAGTKKVIVSIEVTAHLDNLEAVPAIGNFIVGVAATIPAVTEFEQEVTARDEEFRSDGGTVTKFFVPITQSVITMVAEGTKAEIDAFPTTWTHAVIFADLGSVADTFLVMRSPKTRFPSMRGGQASIQMTFEEKV